MLSKNLFKHVINIKLLMRFFCDIKASKCGACDYRSSRFCLLIFQQLISLLPQGFCIRHYSGTDTKATHTQSCVKTHKIFTFSTFFRTNLQKLSLIVSLKGKEGSLPYPSHFCLFNFITTCVCVREREEGGRDGGRELGDVMWDAEMSLCML